MLTRKQHELLMFVSNHIEATGFSPSFEEMTVALSLKSKSGIHRLITALEERGFLRRRAHRARALQVVRLPPNCGLDGAEAILHQGKDKSQIINEERKNRKIPLLGRIAAGVPNKILDESLNRILIPEYLLGKEDYFALEISGDSMIDLGILDGDIAIIQKTENISSGDIAVVIIDRNETTLKKIRVRGSSIALEPANKNYETRIFNPKRLNFQGKLAGIMRKY